MITTRDNLVEILRENGGSENFDEIYRKIESAIKGEDIVKLKFDTTKIILNNVLKNNTKDNKIGGHRLFNKINENKWELIINFYKKEILNSDTNFYLLTTGRYEHRDINYEIYTWNTRRNNKLKIGDLFIYRVPKKVSHNKQFYFFGAGKIESIFYPDKNDPQFQNEGDICARISKG